MKERENRNKAVPENRSKAYRIVRMPRAVREAIDASNETRLKNRVNTSNDRAPYGYPASGKPTANNREARGTGQSIPDRQSDIRKTNDSLKGAVSINEHSDRAPEVRERSRREATINTTSGNVNPDRRNNGSGSTGHPRGNEQMRGQKKDGQPIDRRASPDVPGQTDRQAQDTRSRTVPNRKPQQKKEKSKQVGLIAMMILFSGIFVFSGFRFLSEFIPQLLAKRDESNLQEFIIPTPSIPGQPDPKEDPFYYADPDMEKLKAANSDTVGWIYVRAGEVSMSVVQGSDNDFYLDHTYEKKYNKAGSIFIDANNDGNFNDQNTVIYGHAMKNGSRFGQLNRLRTQENYIENPFIVIKMEGLTYYYQIFAVVTLEADYDYRSSDYGNELESFAQKMKRESHIKSSANVVNGDRIITLSTCVYTITDGRLAVFGLLLNPDGRDIDLSTITP